MRWIVHQGTSNEQKTFMLLNKAKNHADYTEALKEYAAPAQNFVFASKTGDIAMRIQGKFPLKWKEQGKFFMDGADPRMEWQGYIPFEHNANTLNPERGFVSSANQHPVDSTYPYYVFDNSFEHYRNRRLNRELSGMEQITVDDMKALQYDSYNLQAAESLPVLLNLLADHGSSSKEAKKYLADLKAWDFFADPDKKGQTLYSIWFAETTESIWRELMEQGAPVVRPNNYQTIALMSASPEDSVFDVHMAEGIQTAQYGWADYKKTTIQHLVPNFKAFSVAGVYTGGGSGILNATGSRHGASWRMVVELGSTIKAFGIYPGGQSGNPGSRFYDNFIPIWAKGDYVDFNLRKKEDQKGVLFKTTLK